MGLLELLKNAGANIGGFVGNSAKGLSNFVQPETGKLQKLIGYNPQWSFGENMIGKSAPDTSGVNLQSAYPENTQSFLSSIDKNNKELKPLFTPAETSYTPEKVKTNFMQGLNMGNPYLAQKQKELGIKLPQTDKDIESARAGTFNSYPQLNVAVSTAPRQGGMLRDIGDGFRENLNTPFSFDNFGETKIGDSDRNKGFAYKLGEGLGTMARIGDSPIGRTAITAGTIGAFGGSPLEMAAYGGTAGLKNQQLRTADTLYRKGLDKQGVDTANLHGWVTDDIYKNLSNGYSKYANNIYRYIKLNKDTYNREYKQIMDDLNRQMISTDVAQHKLSQLDEEYGRQNAPTRLTESNQTRNTIVNEYLAPHKAGKYDSGAYAATANANTNAERAAENKRHNTVNEGIQKDRVQLQKDKLNQQQKNPFQKEILDGNATISNIDKGIELIKDNKFAYGYLQGSLPHDVTNRLFPGGREARVEIDNITAVYRKWLTGAQMSDKEREAYYRFLPAPTDNHATVTDKLESMKGVIQRKNAAYMKEAEKLDGQISTNKGWAF